MIAPKFRILALLSALFFLVLACSNGGGSPSTSAPSDVSIAAWSTKCPPGQTGALDPIVHFGEAPPVGHVHSFFGPRIGIVPTTSPDALRAGTLVRCTAPSNPAVTDKSAYWVPALYPNQNKTPGTEIHPAYVLTYYRNAGIVPSTEAALPQDLSAVAGDSMATSPQSPTVVQWSCVSTKVNGVDDSVGYGQTIPDSCPMTGVNGAPYQLRVVIFFPQCLQIGADQVNDTSRLARATPLDNPTRTVYRTCSTYGAGYEAIPQVQLGFRWPITSLPVINVNGVPSYDLSQLTLASDNMTMGCPNACMTTGSHGMTAHADFLSGWTQADLDTLQADCFGTTPRNCGAIGGNGT